MEKSELMGLPSWWALALRGLVALAFGIIALIWPGITIGLLVILFGAYVLVDGIFAVIASIAASKAMKHWWALLIEGIFCIIAGIIVFAWPAITALVLIFVIAAWAIVTGIFEIAAFVNMKKAVDDAWLLLLGGIVSLIFGILLFAKPGTSIVALVWLLGIYAIIFGVLLFSLAFVVKGWEKELNKK